MSEIFENGRGGEFAHLFVQENRAPADMMPPDFKEIYERFSNRVIWMDSNVCPGAFQMNTAWYFAVPERDPIFTEHTHPYSELLGFYGSNPDDPYNLNGEIVFSIEGEARRLTKSTMIFVPSGARHNPMRILRVDKPIFHFSVVTNAIYDGNATYK